MLADKLRPLAQKLDILQLFKVKLSFLLRPLNRELEGFNLLGERVHLGASHLRDGLGRYAVRRRSGCRHVAA